MKMPNRPVIAFLASSVLVLGLTACGGTPPPRPAAEPAQVEEPVQLYDARTDSQQTTENKGEIRVKENRPRQYTVKKGDTLWDISSLFLKDPWYWPEIWNTNPQVENPHLIYPGDVLTLVYINGRPQMLVNQAVSAGAGGSVAPTGVREIKMSPTIRRNPLQADIPSIPGDAIRQFITRPRVVTRAEYDNAPYILGSDDKRLVLSQGNRIYVRGELDKERIRYTIFRPGKELTDPDTNELLGYEAIYAGEAVIDVYGDPAVGYIAASEREILIGDRLLPTDKSKINNLYFPKVPEKAITGKIISLFDGLFGIAKFQVAVINRGDRDGVEVGHLFASYTRGDMVFDRFDQRAKEEIQLPDERSGLIMVFRSFDDVSYGVVLESTNVIRNRDVVTTPN